MQTIERPAHRIDEAQRPLWFGGMPRAWGDVLRNGCETRRRVVTVMSERKLSSCRVELTDRRLQPPAALSPTGLVPENHDLVHRGFDEQRLKRHRPERAPRVCAASLGPAVLTQCPRLAVDERSGCAAAGRRRLRRSPGAVRTD